MSAPVLTARSDESLNVVAARMHENNVGSVVVVDDGRCAGILTERDLLRATAATAPAGDPVDRWMTRDPVTLPTTASWNEASDILSRLRFRHIPVLDEHGALAGLVSLRDLMKMAYLLATESKPADGGRIDAPPGLDNVAVARTSVGDVQGQQGFYHYRG